MLCQITAAITGSLGNFFATEDKHAGYALFKKVEFLNFWLYGFSFIALVTLLDPFVQIWAGGRFVLGLPMSIAIAINFFVVGYHHCDEYAYFKSVVKDRIIAPIRGKLR